MIVSIAVILILLVVGQAMTYHNPYKTDIDSYVDDGLEYDIYTNYGTQYSALSLNNGNIQCDKFYAYYDRSYSTVISFENQMNGINSIKKELETRGFTLEMIDADELLSLMELEISGSTFNSGVIFLGGSMPSNIYDGTEDSKIVEWLKEGGIMYWTGESFGRYYSEKLPSEPIPVEDSDMIFFGVNNVVRDTSGGRVFDRTMDDGLTTILSMYYNECTFGANTSLLTEGTYLSFSYNYEGYSAVSMMKMNEGSGMICIFGGYVTGNMSPSIAQTIASGITYETTIIDHEKGTKTEGTVHGSLDHNLTGPTTIYIFLGDFEVNIGKRFSYPSV